LGEKSREAVRMFLKFTTESLLSIMKYRYSCSKVTPFSIEKRKKEEINFNIWDKFCTFALINE